MKKRELTVLGSIGNGEIVGGQVTKINAILEYLKKYDENILFLNVDKKHYVKTALDIANAIQESKNICVILATHGYFKIIGFVMCFADIFGCNIHEVVIGGIRHQYLNRRRLFFEKRVKKIYVETENMKAEYLKLGLEQTIVMANCKNFIPLTEKEVLDCCQCENKAKGLRLCTFSRVDSSKGIDTAIQIINRIQNKNVSLDIYGPVDISYENEFGQMLRDCNNTAIRWVGVIETERAQEVLKQYDLLLFPTHWEAEGFPGTFIDAFSSALPILASRKKNFEGIVKNDYNGFLVSENDMDEYCEKIILLYDNPQLLHEMKFNAWKSSYSYLADRVLVTLKEEIYK